VRPASLILGLGLPGENPSSLGKAASTSSDLPDVLELLGKEAFWQGAVRGARKFIPAMVSKAQGTGLTRGLGKEMMTQTGAGAALGGLLEGGISAYSAEDGQKGKAFLHGAAHGAATGALAGAATAPVTTAARNLRLKGLERMAGPGGADLAQKQLQRSWTGGIKDLATGKGPMGRRGAAFETFAAPATLAAEVAIPGAVLGGMGHGDQQPPPAAGAPPAPGQMQQMQPKIGAWLLGLPASSESKTAGDQPEPIEPIIGTALGGPLGAASVEGALQAFYDPYYPKARDLLMRRQLLPALGGAAGVLGGYYGVKELNKQRAAEAASLSADPAEYGALPALPAPPQPAPAPIAAPVPSPTPTIPVPLGAQAR